MEEMCIMCRVEGISMMLAHQKEIKKCTTALLLDLLMGTISMQLSILVHENIFIVVRVLREDKITIIHLCFGIVLFVLDVLD